MDMLNSASRDDIESLRDALSHSLHLNPSERNAGGEEGTGNFRSEHFRFRNDESPRAKLYMPLLKKY